ncbi:Vacuolar protein sorting-associated protein 53 [Coemansia guatemalensis]|uniref:Vacuolar protein sorting-associated protein 53 n=1 Tax=Coemansia guatemalensis TaxID=2761395 RepID=A0A9W8HZ27_9FUNG|nr:Vacuolar protein sorting-associated protein 53 [Coemansia guatemalensis]
MSSSASSPSERQALDSTEFSAARYVDELLPNAATLAGVEAIRARIAQQRAAAQQAVEQRQRAAADGGRQTEGVVEATAAIATLHGRVTAMRGAAQRAERMVFDMTQDIKALDAAKRNVAAVAAAAQQLQQLAAATARLREECEQQRLGDAAATVATIDGLRKAVAGLRRVRAVEALARAAEAQQRTAGDVAVAAVQRAFDAQGRLVAGAAGAAQDACRCSAAAGGRARVVDWYCGEQLRAYSALFPADAAAVEHVARRYAWLRRILRNAAEDHAQVFPADWRMPAQVARRFAVATRAALDAAVGAGAHADISTLATAIGETRAFETQCDQRFAPAQHGEAEFSGTVLEAFSPLVAAAVRGECTQLEQLVRRLGAQRDDAADEAGVLASGAELLYQMREALRRGASVAAGDALADLARGLARVLDTYAHVVLTPRLGRAAAGASSGATAALNGLAAAAAVANTADYCAAAAEQLERRLAERVDARVSFADSRDALLSAAAAAITALVDCAVAMVAPALAALPAQRWDAVHAVGDQSEYVAQAASAIDAAVAAARRHLVAPRHFRAFSDRLAARFAERLAAAVGACRRVSEVGAEQLLLDAQALRAVLLAAPGAVPPAYARIVARGFGRVEALLKALLAPARPAALAERFVLLFPAAPRDTFRLVLRLKGLPPPEHGAYERALDGLCGSSEEQAADSEDQGADTEPLATPLGESDADAEALAAPEPGESAVRARFNENLRRFMGGMRLA